MKLLIFFKKYFLRRDNDLLEIVGKSGGAFILRVIGLGINYIFLILITKFFGGVVWGIFALCFSLLRITSLFGVLGANLALVKIIAQQEYDLKKLYINVIARAIPLALLLTSLIFIFSDNINSVFEGDNVDMTIYIRTMSLGILPFAISMINGGVFNGKKLISLFTFYDSMGRFLFGGMFVFFLFLFGRENSLVVVEGFVLGLFVLSIISSLQVIRLIKGARLEGVKKEFNFKSFLRLSIPLFWSNFMNAGSIYAATFILGIFLSKEEVGLFDTVNRIASLLTIILFAVTSISSPKFAESYLSKKALQKNVRLSSKLIFYTTIALSFIMVVMGRFIIDLLGYSQFETAYYLLLIILLGQIINNFTGCVGALMQMIGYHKLLQKISIGSFCFVVVGMLIITPLYGLYGAAIIVGLNISLKNILSSVLIYRKANITTIYLPKLFK